MPRRRACDACQINDEALELAARRGAALAQAHDEMQALRRENARLTESLALWKHTATLGFNQVIVLWMESERGAAALAAARRE